MFNRILFKRFFYPKKSNNKVDYVLTIIFLLMISLSCSLLIRFSMDIFLYENEIIEFNSDELNKLFRLNLSNLVDTNIYPSSSSFVENYRSDSRLNNVGLIFEDKLLGIDEKYNKLSCFKGYRDYPWTFAFESNSSFAPLLRIDIIDIEAEEIMNNLKVQTGLTLNELEKGKYLFVHNSVAAKYSLTDDQMIYLNSDYFFGGSKNKYETPLYVKIINSPNLNWFVLDHYLCKSEECWIKIKFDNFDNALNFSYNNLFVKNNYNPVYIGKEIESGRLHPFIVFSKNNERLMDKMVSLNAIVKNDQDLEISSEVISFAINNDESTRENLIINPNEIIHIKRDNIFEIFQRYNKNPEQDKCNFNSNLLSNNNGDFYALINFKDGFYNAQKQVEFLPIFEEQNIEIYFQPDEPGRDLMHYYIYYDDFTNIELSKDLMELFNTHNVLWDSGRWQNIINLSESLLRARDNTQILMIITLITFIIFLTIKFYLKLKLEFHTIGTVRTFGYSIKEITANFVIGYIILLTAGFFIGIVVATIMASLTGYPVSQSLSIIAQIFSNPLNPVIGFYISVVVITIIVINLIIKKLIKNDEIYELMKYEN